MMPHLDDATFAKSEQSRTIFMSVVCLTFSPRFELSMEIQSGHSLSTLLLPMAALGWFAT
jgi:hypothetical protein